MNLKQTIKKILREQTESVHCDCGWSWKLSEGGDDPYVCHKCGKDNSKKIIYPFDKIEKFVKWFNDEYGDYSNKQGWAIFDSDTELPNEKYHSVRNYRGKILNGYYWQIQRLDNPDENEALFGKLSNDLNADRMARKIGIMVDEFGVIYGYDGVSFLEN
jgi:hypothetical protein